MRHSLRIFLWGCLLCGVPMIGPLATISAAVAADESAAQTDADSADGEEAEGDQEGVLGDGDEQEGEEGEDEPRGAAVPTDRTWGHQDIQQKRPQEGYLSLSKFLPVVLLFLGWVTTGDWVNRSSQRYHLGYSRWNLIVFVPFVLALLLFVLVPMYAATLSLLTLAYLGPLVAFTVVHNRAVEPHQRVFTGEWFRFTVASWASQLGLRIETERKAAYDKGAAVDLEPRGGDETANKGNLIVARQSPGYVLLKDLIAELAARRCDQVVFDYTEAEVRIQQMVDGVWNACESRDRDSGDVILAVMKQLANLDINERRKKQKGQFGASFDGVKYTCALVSQGTKTGERVTLELSGRAAVELQSFEDLGMRQKILEQWRELINQDQGLLIIAAKPLGGLTALTDVTISESDRLMRDFVAVEDVNDPQLEFENVAVTTYDRQVGESPATVLPALIRKYPGVYIVRDLVDPESAKLLLEQVQEGRLVLTTARASDAPETLLRLLQQKVPHQELVEAVTAVLATRLIRKLCPECKVGYPPAPQLLQKLGVPAGKVEQLYREPKAEEIDRPCQHCGGVGYVGRTGLYELLVVNDQVRQVLLKQPKLDLLKKASRLAGMRTFQEEAVLLVVKGVTSLQEVMRVLKE